MTGRVHHGLLFTAEALACICIHMVLGEWRVSLLLSHWYMAQPFVIK